MRRVQFSLLIATVALTLAASAMAQDAAPAETALAVAEMAFGSGYDRETRNLVDEATTFPAGIETIYCRTRITGAAEPTSVTHVWYRDGKTMAHVELNVGSMSWRTVSSKSLLPDWGGEWEVRVLDAAGNLLRSATFTVE